MEKGISKHWTPEQDAQFKRMLDAPLSFAMRFILTSIRNLLKYDHRTRESKKARARLHLMLATATDDDLAELEALQKEKLGEEGYRKLAEETLDFWEIRERVRATGIPRELIER